MHFLRNPALGLDYGAAKIAAANAELDRNVALLLLAVDEGRTRHQIDGRHLAQRYLCDLIGDWILYRDGQATNRLYALPVFRRQSNNQREVPVAPLLIEIARSLSADGGLNGCIDVARGESITRGCLPIDVDTERRLPQRREYRKVGYTTYFAHRSFDLLCRFRQHDNVVADQLDRVLAFDAGYSLLDVILDVLREIEVDARKLCLQSFIDLFDELVLGDPLAPFLSWLEWGKKLGIEETRSIGAIVGPALLGHDRLHFGKILDRETHAVDEVIALFERDRRRHGCANPEIAFLQMRQEFEPQEPDGEQRERQ